jgi:hypothetical protein
MKEICMVMILGWGSYFLIRLWDERDRKVMKSLISETIRYTYWRVTATREWDDIVFNALQEHDKKITEMQGQIDQLTEQLRKAHR